ncbi:hypothetical protein EN759_40105, partial [Mesorhizobium sp. M00.F.Ca.ET.038.03.1.1]
RHPHRPLCLTAAKFWTRTKFKGTLALKRHISVASGRNQSNREPTLPLKRGTCATGAFCAFRSRAATGTFHPARPCLKATEGRQLHQRPSFYSSSAVRPMSIGSGTVAEKISR